MGRASIQSYRTGDVFRIPVDDNAAGFGQVISINATSPLFVFVYEPLFATSIAPDLNEIVNSPILLAANTFDALIRNGHWQIVGWLPVDPNRVHYPQFVVMCDGLNVVEDFEGRQVRRAAQRDISTLPLRYSRMPIGLEKAFLAHHGIGVWSHDDDKMLYDNVIKYASM